MITAELLERHRLTLDGDGRASATSRGEAKLRQKIIQGERAMTTAELLERFRLTLDDLIKAARREAALRKNSADKFVQSGKWKPEEARLRVAEMEAIAGVLENLKLGQTYTQAMEQSR
jgi:hypothetical protein